jgi:ectoine hydroxylase-related dioxygenase (phytanoyl-CoA dioxygenase family)
MAQTIDGFDTAAHLSALATEGFTVIPGFLSPTQLDRVRQGLAPHLGARSGRNDFEGFDTERVYTLVARGRLFEDLAEDPRLLALLDANLLPGYLLTATQAINIRPGETAQPLHVDDGFYRLPRPRPAVSFSMILAIDDFTAENGATEVIPGSHLWDMDRAAEAAELRGPTPTPMVMTAGSCIVFSGVLIHRGGANRSPAPRLAITYQYCQPWGRTQENYFLAIPPDRVRAMSPRVQGLLGYAIWPPFMGHVTASHPLKTLEPGYQAPAAREAWTEEGLGS